MDCNRDTRRREARRMIVRAIPSVDDLVAEHLQLVGVVVRTLRKLPCVKRLGDEAYSVGRFALWKAATNYDHTRGVLFKTYAETFITKDVTREAGKHAKAMGLRLINPDALEDDCHEAPVPEPKPKRKRGRPRLLFNPYDSN